MSVLFLLWYIFCLSYFFYIYIVSVFICCVFFLYSVGLIFVSVYILSFFFLIYIVSVSFVLRLFIYSLIFYCYITNTECVHVWWSALHTIITYLLLAYLSPVTCYLLPVTWHLAWSKVMFLDSLWTHYLYSTVWTQSYFVHHYLLTYYPWHFFFSLIQHLWFFFFFIFFIFTLYSWYFI